MSYPVYYVIEGDTLPVLFNTFDSNDPSASVTLTGLAATDIEIYKDGGTTQRASDAGYTLLDTDGIDFDGTTGIHGFSIDLSDNTDAGFYEVGPWYHVVVASVTVDGATINFVACAFRILDATRGMAGTALPDAAADEAGGLIISDAGGLDADAQAASVSAIETDTSTTLNNLVDDLESRLGTPTDFGSGTSTIAANLQDLADNGTATFDRSTDSLQALRDHIADGTNLTEAGGNGDHLTAINLPNQTMNITGNITGNLSGSVGSVTGAVGSVTGDVGGIAAGGLTEDAMADDFRDALGLLVTTTIATLASQTSFTLTAGSADDSAYVGATIVITDASTNAQKAVGLISAYTGASKTVTLDADPGVFTMAASDIVNIFPSTKSLPAALPDTAGGLPVSDAGGLDLDTMDSNVSAILADTGTDGVVVTGTPDVNVAQISGDSTAADNAELFFDGTGYAGGTTKLGVDIVSVSGDSTAADRLEALMDGIIIGQVNDASATTTAFAADGFTEATDDHFNGRLITFISGALAGQQTAITDYDAADGPQGSQEFTVAALTEAPANDVFFAIH